MIIPNAKSHLVALFRPLKHHLTDPSQDSLTCSIPLIGSDHTRLDPLGLIRCPKPLQN